MIAEGLSGNGGQSKNLSTTAPGLSGCDSVMATISQGRPAGSPASISCMMSTSNAGTQ